MPHQGTGPINNSGKSLRPVFVGVLAAKAAIALFLVLQLVLLPHAVNSRETREPAGSATIAPTS